MNEKKPNILFILSDQHGQKYMSNSGHEIVQTPQLDKLAKESTLFSNCYCQNPLCVPSRASLLTGKYSKNLGIYENRHILEANSTTLPRILSENGYTTCAIGKTHFNGDQYHGYQQRPYGDLFGQAHQPDPARTPDQGFNGLGDVLDNSGESKLPLPLTQTEIVVSESTKWLQSHIGQSKDIPFMLSVNFDKPHFPMRVPKKYFDKYKDIVSLPKYPKDFLDKSAVKFVKEAVRVNGEIHHYNKDEDIHLKALAAYYAGIEWVDDALGRVIDTLDYLGLGEDTIVIYSSDHGEMACEKGFWQKTVFYDSSSKVPLIIRMPKKYRKHFEDKQIVGLVDILPTLCDLCGINIPKGSDGESLVPSLINNKNIKREHIFSESSVLMEAEYSGCMLRNNKYKFNYYLDGEHELYDMENDKGEWNNLFKESEYKEISKGMIAEIEEFWQPQNQLKRYYDTPRMKKQKDQYFYSNQFITASGRIIDARP